MSNYEMQAQIRYQNNILQDTFKSLRAWENDMKRKEEENRQMSKGKDLFDESQPIRGQSQSQSKSKPSSDNAEPKPKIQAKAPSLIEKANEFKNRGNDCVKLAQFEKAIRYYTEAIRLNKSEAVYYTNRAFCYLKQKKFIECIEDCNAATALDKTAVKAFYRRMQANEQMEDGDLKEAVSDCETVLKLEPKNVDAQRSLDRIRKRLPSSNVFKEIKPTTVVKRTKLDNWSQLKSKPDYERIDFISKAPHLQAKDQLKRIQIGDGSVKKPNLVKVMSSSSIEEIPPKIEQPIKKCQPTNSQPTNGNMTYGQPNNGKFIMTAAPLKIQIPKTSAQFFKTWISLKNTEQKFEVLKGIYNQDVTKLLGAQLSLNIVRDILSILKTKFVQENLPISNIINGMVKNREFEIIGVMMNADDKNTVATLFNYMTTCDQDKKKVNGIKEIYEQQLVA